MLRYSRIDQGNKEVTSHDAGNEGSIVPLLENEATLEPKERTITTGLFHIVLFLSIAVFLLSISAYGVLYSFAVTDASCQQRMWPFSPEVNDLEYERRQLDSDLISREYLGIPTMERLDAWNNLWKTGRISFPADKLSLINKSAETKEWWSLPSPRDNELIAMSEGKSQLKNLCYLVRFGTDLSTVMHQVHCVGVLWFFAHRDEWDFRTILNKSEDFMKIHARHCNVLLFNMIKCMSDVTPVLFQQDRGNSISGSGLGEWKTRDAPRRCKRFDKLWDWERENRICPMACEPEDIAALYLETSLTE